MRIFEKLKEFIDSQVKKGPKKVIESLTIVFIIGVIAIIAGGSFMGRETGKEEENQRSVSIDSGPEDVYPVSSSLEKLTREDEIESILSQIEGAGKVSLIITYVSGKEMVPALDSKKTQSTTTEKDNGGGTRHVAQEDFENRIIFEENNSTRKPVVIKELHPVPKGAVIIADGAGNFEVRENLSRAAQVLLDLPLHKIQVFKRK